MGAVTDPCCLFSPLVEVVAQEPVQDLPLLCCSDAGQIQLRELGHQAASETRRKPASGIPTFQASPVTQANDVLKAFICVSLPRLGCYWSVLTQSTECDATYPTILKVCLIFPQDGRNKPVLAGHRCSWNREGCASSLAAVSLT